MALLFIAALVLVLSLWLWANIFLVHHSSQPARRRPVAVDSPASREGSNPALARNAAGMPRPEGLQGNEPTSAFQQDVSSTHETRRAVVEETAAACDVEIVTLTEKNQGSAGSKVFRQQNPPYYLDLHSVPVFADEPWQTCFSQLTSEPSVLGWAAFYGETVGAADRHYDANFCAALHTYQQSVELLRKETGLAQVNGSSVTGGDGKIWFIHEADGVCLVLFVERDVDVERIMAPLLSEAGGL